MVCCACSNEDENSPGGIGDVETNYLSVNIVSGGETRAGETYLAGTKDENHIKRIRFYFFNEDGSAANVIGTTGSNGESHLNYLEFDESHFTENNVKPGSGTGSTEEVVNTLLIIQTPKDKLPKLVYAMVNPTNEASTNVALSALIDYSNSNTKLRKDYAAADYTKEGTFPMANAVYAGEDKMIVATNVSGYFRPTADAAKSTPVSINVERCVAKVLMSVTIPSDNVLTVGGKTLYKTGEKDGPDGETTGVDIYVNFLGWDITTKKVNAPMVKRVNPAWAESSDFFGNNYLWNDAGNKRSYWAYDDAPRVFDYGTFNEHVKACTQFGKDEKAVNWLYCNENAGTDVGGSGPGSGQRTQVIVAAQLCDKTGKPITVVDIKGVRVSQSDLETLLPTDAYVKRIQLNGSPLTYDNFEFKTAVDFNAKETDKRYAVYLQLKDNLTGTLTFDGQDIELQKLNEELKKAFGIINYWKDGYTYYYADIKHLGSLGNVREYGVVRNHAYKFEVQSLTGLGTPVYDPEEEIIPEHPESNESFLAASIKILSWRIVNNYAKFDW